MYSCCCCFLPPKSSPPISTSEPFLSLQHPEQANTHKRNRMPDEKMYLKHVHILENVVNVCIINDLSYPPATYLQIIRMHLFNHPTHRTHGLSTAPVDITRFARFSQQKLPNCYSKLAQSRFEGGSSVKIGFQGVKCTFFGGDPPVKFAFQGLNITLLGSLQPADMKNNPWQQS